MGHVGTPRDAHLDALHADEDAITARLRAEMDACGSDVLALKAFNRKCWGLRDEYARQTARYCNFSAPGNAAKWDRAATMAEVYESFAKAAWKRISKGGE